MYLWGIDIAIIIILQVNILFNIIHIAVNVNSWDFNIHNRIVTF